MAKLGIPRATFYLWYDRHSSGGPEALDDRSPRPDRVWNRIPHGVRDNLIQLALEASVCRLMKAHNLIASPAFIVIKAADAFEDKTTAPNQQWQTDSTYLRVIGWAGSICRPCSTVLGSDSERVGADIRADGREAIAAKIDVTSEVEWMDLIAKAVPPIAGSISW